ncbi:MULTISPECIES: hypothetical protein [Clostridium]|uniref:Uncharacterized protein n=2 Tax=Clostridium TaxID=1485 RepID=D8GK40_CLOLD|nr:MULTISPECIES: hypothetical protein [Clostridium]ADK13158.1 hypothetical protein CLJU_c00510 [Clostridium ljungdahlii DSM 13528]AGY76382.1 hypothetical protein CAETHG_2169 [Clostridium autoethanogenum DSM 10061]ALU36545.1 Hypothetical protein CLAU_2116 [Clostridium autoethanogenum DSM 10061]OAA84397.1 hypothetical protein WX45_01060 [Clostridium ljungdahlii DSM 13528]OVY48631.1 hypothetical protein WX72_00452 [Clostridium autoethanogenum]
MNGQYKLFKIFEYQETLQVLNELFGKQQILNINSKLIGIRYDYSKNQYVDILRKVNDLNIGQKIITSRAFIKMFRACIERRYFIKKLQIIESVPEDMQQFINDNIQKINSESEFTHKIRLANFLISKLNWLRRIDGIDVKLLSFRIKGNNNIKIGVSIFNNGVISVDDDSILDELVELINKIIK